MKKKILVGLLLVATVVGLAFAKTYTYVKEHYYECGKHFAWSEACKSSSPHDNVKVSDAGSCAKCAQEKAACDMAFDSKNRDYYDQYCTGN